MLAPFAALARALPQPFKDAISTIVGLFTTMLGAVSSTFSAMSGLPVIGGQFKGIADAIDNARDSMDDFRDLLDETKAPKINLNDSLRALQEIQGTKIEPKVMKILANDRPATEKIDALIALGIPTQDGTAVGEHRAPVEWCEGREVCDRDGAEQNDPYQRCR